MKCYRLDREQDGGFTLVELLVVIAILSIVVSLLSGTIISSFTTQRRQLDQVEALNESKVAFERITRDVRAADPVEVAEGDEFRARICRNGSYQDVVYRRNGAALLDTRDATLVRGLAYEGDQEVFTYLDGQEQPADEPADVRFVIVRLRTVLPETGAVIDLDNRITLRNAQESLSCE